MEAARVQTLHDSNLLRATQDIHYIAGGFGFLLLPPVLEAIFF